MNSSEFFIWRTKRRGANVFDQFTKNSVKLWKDVFLQFTMGLLGSSSICNLIKPLTEGGFWFILRYFHLSPYEIEAPSSMHSVAAYWYWAEGYLSRIRNFFSEMYSWNFPIVTFFIHDQNNIAFRRFLNSSVTRGHFRWIWNINFLYLLNGLSLRHLFSSSSLMICFKFPAAYQP
jgi:hypothetical protein